MKWLWIFVTALVLVVADDDKESSSHFLQYPNDFKESMTSAESEEETINNDFEAEEAESNGDAENGDEDEDMNSNIKDANTEINNSNVIQGRTREKANVKKDTKASSRFFGSSVGFESNPGDHNSFGSSRIVNSGGFGGGHGGHSSFGITSISHSSGFGSGLGSHSSFGSSNFGPAHGIGQSSHHAGPRPVSSFEGITSPLNIHSGFGGISSQAGIGINPVAISSKCRYWCRTPQGQVYCCEDINQPQSFPVVKPGRCPPVRPVCVPVRSFTPPRTCSNDGSCGGIDKCCYDVCLLEHTCKAPLRIGR